MTETFTFDNTLASDLALVRFHIGDTEEEGNYLWDETIEALITSEGSVGGAVIACIKYILTQLSSPDFKKDWLEVTKSSARRGFETLLRIKSQEFGISLGATATASIGKPYRDDSYQYSSTSRTETTDEETAVHDGSP